MKKLLQLVIAFTLSITFSLAIILAISPEFGVFLKDVFKNKTEIVETFIDNLDEFKYDQYARLKGSWRLEVGETLNLENQDVETIIINDNLNTVTFITKQGEFDAPITYFDDKQIKVKFSNGITAFTYDVSADFEKRTNFLYLNPETTNTVLISNYNRIANTTNPERSGIYPE
jgi:hypothetical protein